MSRVSFAAATFEPALDQSFHLQNSPVVDPHRSRFAVRKLLHF
jgi:hypothetical protein